MLPHLAFGDEELKEGEGGKAMAPHHLPSERTGLPGVPMVPAVFVCLTFRIH